jgi:hypothetical protein
VIITRGAITLLLEKLPQQTLGRSGIAAALDQDVEHHSMLVDGAKANASGPHC